MGCTMIGDDGLCRCDMFDAPHPPGQIVDDVFCELLWTQQTISPHMFDPPPPQIRRAGLGAPQRVVQG